LPNYLPGELPDDQAPGRARGDPKRA